MVIRFKTHLAAQTTEVLAFAAVKALLNGQAQVAYALAPDCGEWRPYLTQLFASYQAGGYPLLRDDFAALSAQDPTFHALLAAYMDGVDPATDWHSAAQLVATAGKPATPANASLANASLANAPAFVIPGLLPAGLAILAGRPKLGKSWLALQLAAAVEAATPCLGFPIPTPGRPVFYFALEDTPQRFAQRLLRQGATHLHDLAVTTTCLPFDGPGCHQVDQALDAGYEFIIVDTITRALSPRAISDPARVLASLEHLHQLAHRYNACILLVDHHRKTGRSSPATGSPAGNPAGNPVDDILGGTAKAGVIDAAYGLYRAHGEDTALLRVSGRDLPELDLRLQWDPATCTWSNCGDNTTLAHTERQQEILAALATLGPSSLAALTAYTGQNKSNLFRRLKTLLQTATIQRTCDNHHVVVYSLPDTPLPPTTPTIPTTPSPFAPAPPTTPPTTPPTPSTTTQP